MYCVVKCICDKEIIRFASERRTDPVEAGLPAELVSPCRAEVIVRPEGLVERGDEVEKSLPATLVTQRVFPVLTALPQPGQKKKKHRENPLIVLPNSGLKMS